MLADFRPLFNNGEQTAVKRNHTKEVSREGKAKGYCKPKTRDTKSCRVKTGKLADGCDGRQLTRAEKA